VRGFLLVGYKAMIAEGDDRICLFCCASPRNEVQARRRRQHKGLDAKARDDLCGFRVVEIVSSVSRELPKKRCMEGFACRIPNVAFGLYP
jgi:hypothetical protein